MKKIIVLITALFLFSFKAGDAPERKIVFQFSESESIKNINMISIARNMINNSNITVEQGRVVIVSLLDSLLADLTTQFNAQIQTDKPSEKPKK